LRSSPKIAFGGFVLAQMASLRGLSCSGEVSTRRFEVARCPRKNCCAMLRTEPERAAARTRVRALLSAAKALVAQRASHLNALAEQTGLSREGVELALTQSLETDASEAELEQLLDSVAPQPQVSVILSANVFTAAARALVLALASAPRVVVKLSSREPLFPQLLLAHMEPDNGTEIELVDALHLESVNIGHVHAYGRSETLDAIARDVRVPLWRHGPGFGVAEVSGELSAAAEALAVDLALFDQQGCLSPRIVFVADEQVVAFAPLLAQQLAAMQQRVPRGRVTAEQRTAIARYRQTMRALGSIHEGDGFLVGVSTEIVLPPAMRSIHLCSKSEATQRWLQEHAAYITAFGHDAKAPSFTIPRARYSALGYMQRPRLDGPVDRRTGCPER
jgi:hypothetical protein